jgi:hypothetical protein
MRAWVLAAVLMAMCWSGGAVERGGKGVEWKGGRSGKLGMKVNIGDGSKREDYLARAVGSMGSDANEWQLGLPGG